jgi:hypothetical protein
MEKEFKVVKSVQHSNYEAIKNIMELHGIERFDLDCTYSKGNFWKDLPDPVNKTDLYPHYDHVIQANSENLPFEDGSIIAKRFEGYTTYKELQENYYNTLKELYRICEKDGIVVMKCQDTVSGGKQHFSHVMIMNMAFKLGFYPLDMFVLVNNVRLNSFGTKWTKQEHCRKYHSYFWVFKKTKPKVNYDFIGF